MILVKLAERPCMGRDYNLLDTTTGKFLVGGGVSYFKIPRKFEQPAHLYHKDAIELAARLNENPGLLQIYQQ